MATSGILQPNIVRVLTVMLVVSFLITTLTLAIPKLADAEWYCLWKKIGSKCHCDLWFECMFPAGTHGYKCTDIYQKYCCDAYHCWWINEYQERPGWQGCTWCF